MGDAGAEGVWEAKVTQLEMTYIGRCRAAVAQWGVPHTLFEVYARKKRYEGGDHMKEDLWCQEATEKQL